MRHLFVPACLCLMSLPGAIGKEPGLSLANFTGVLIVNENIAADYAAVPETTKDLDNGDPLGGITVRNKGQDDDENASPAAPADDSFDPAAALDTNEPATAVLPQQAPLPPKPKPIVDRSREEICDALTKAARRNDVPVPFFIRLLFQESRFQPGVVSSAGAEGIAQFMPETSASVGLQNPFDPLQAIPAAARLLGNLVQQFGNLGLAAAAYNAGPRRIQDWLARKGPLPQETKGYVKTITGRAPETWTKAASGSPALKLPRRAPCQEAAGLLAWNGPERIPLPPVAKAKKRMPQLASANAHVAVSARAKLAPAAASQKQLARATKKKAKVPLARIAAAGHRHRHKGEKVAQN